MILGSSRNLSRSRSSFSRSSNSRWRRSASRRSLSRSRSLSRFRDLDLDLLLDDFLSCSGEGVCRSFSFSFSFFSARSDLSFSVRSVRSDRSFSMISRFFLSFSFLASSSSAFFLKRPISLLIRSLLPSSISIDGIVCLLRG